ncbi:hypothetical protein ANCDUO_08144, partial [Ancylostoma duodenale]
MVAKNVAVNSKAAISQEKVVSMDTFDPETSAKCENGGFPHPRKCNECIRPGGYVGPLCDELAPDNKKIEINLVSFYIKATIGCAKGGVEIKANANHTLTG